MNPISRQFSIRVHGPLRPLQHNEASAEQTDLTNEPRLAATLGVDALRLDLALRRLPNLFLEPDGSFLWSGYVDAFQDRQRWKLEGTFYEHDGFIQFMELSGNCSLEAWKSLLGCLGAIAKPTEDSTSPDETNSDSASLSIHELVENRWFSPRDFIRRIFEQP